MKKNDSLPFWDAVKVYFGESLVKVFLVMFFIPVITVLFFIASFQIMGGTGGINGPMGGAMLFFSLAYMIFMVDLRINNANLPGNKFLKTVKGGFGTYVKASVTITVVSTIISLLYCIIAAVLYLADITMLFFSPAFCFATGISTFVLIAMIGFLRIIENTSIRMVVYSIFMFVGMFLIILLFHTVKSINAAVAAISFVVSILLIVISEVVSISYYKKNVWEK
ncbi:MAG: hypothetical protein GXY08_00380 [Ruminococcus sp.]|nr:hypothetical protein [Ruminococcus sp.]